MNIQLTLPLPKTFLKDNNKFKNGDFPVCSSYLTSETLWREERDGSWAFDGREGRRKTPRKDPGRLRFHSLMCPSVARGTILLPQLAVGSPRHPGRAPPALPGERRRLRPAEEGVEGVRLIFPPRRGEASGVSAALGAGRAQGKRRKEKSGGVPRGAPRLGGCAAATTGPKSSRLGGEGGPERGREGGKEEGRAAPPTAPSSRAAAGPRRDRARARARAPGRDPAPRADCVI